MNPYIKKVVELHKIHKAIENCDCKKDDGGESGGGDSNSIIEAIKNLHVYLTEEGAKKVTNSGTVDFNQGIKDSFLPSTNNPSDDWVSVPIEDYLYVSDINALKALIEIILSHNREDVNNFCYIYDKTIGNQHFLDTATNADCLLSNYAVFVEEEPHYYANISYIETGPGSYMYPNVNIWIDPNDYTKALVSPNDI